MEMEFIYLMKDLVKQIIIKKNYLKKIMMKCKEKIVIKNWKMKKKMRIWKNIIKKHINN